MRQLLPPGWILPQGLDSNLGKLLLGVSGELERLTGRTCDLIEEADPRTAAETLSDWERIWGLPSGCGTPPDTVEGRRAALLARVLASNGSSPLVLEQIARAFGGTVTVHRHRPTQFGTWELGPCEFGPAETRFLVTIDFGLRPVRRFEFGLSQFGWDPFSWVDGNSGAECALTEAAPAHVRLLFTYQGQDAAVVLWLPIERTPGVFWWIPREAAGIAVRVGGGDGLRIPVVDGTIPVGSAGGGDIQIPLQPHGSNWLLAIGMANGEQIQVHVEHDHLDFEGGSETTLYLDDSGDQISVGMADGSIMKVNLRGRSDG
ncbi:MAG: putative phage tail protein [Planctomycetota bacterium]